MAKSNKFRAAIGTFRGEVRQADVLPVARMADELQTAISQAEALAPGSDQARVTALDLVSKFLLAGYGRRKVEQHMTRKPSTLQRYFTVAGADVKRHLPVPEGYKTWRQVWQDFSLRELAEMVKAERDKPSLQVLLVRGFGRTIRAILTTEYLYDATGETWYSTNLREVLSQYLTTGEVNEHSLMVGDPVEDEQTLKLLEARFEMDNN